jgi:acetylornithine/succinyldiaminopimelate/putrescine aminotransferase
MTLAKGLGGGIPIGAMLCTAEVGKGFETGAHATTFGGTPFACRVGFTGMRIIEQEGLCGHAASVGEYLLAGLQSFVGKYEGVTGARGRGLLAGLGVDPKVIDRNAVIARCRENGLLLSTAGEDAFRFTPPLIAGRSHVDDALERFEKSLREVQESKKA